MTIQDMTRVLKRKLLEVMLLRQYPDIVKYR
jgi:hypothetical protein